MGFLTFLYALISIVVAVGWFPQIYRLARLGRVQKTSETNSAAEG